MPAQVYMPLVAAAPHEWQISYDHMQHNMMPLQDVMNPEPPTSHHPSQPSPYLSHHPQQQPPQHPQHQHQRPASQYQPPSRHRPEPPPTPTFQQGQSGPWSTHDDEVLVQARTMNMAWGAIHEKHFPTKTANACRKRYERLMLRRRGNEWDEDRTARLAVAYKEMREEIWSPLAQKLGERWEHVEKTCMEKGLRNMLTLASSHSRGNSNRHPRISPGFENDQYPRDRDRAEREDSGIAFAPESSSRRSSHSNGGAVSSWQQQVLQPPRRQ